MYGNPLNPFNPYWWTGDPGLAIPTRQRSYLKQLCIFELPTTNVALSETSVDYGIDKCLYNQLPCECYVTVQVNQAVPTGGEALPVPKEKVKELLTRYGVTLELDNGSNS